MIYIGFVVAMSMLGLCLLSLRYIEYVVHIMMYRDRDDKPIRHGGLIRLSKFKAIFTHAEWVRVSDHPESLFRKPEYYETYNKGDAMDQFHASLIDIDSVRYYMLPHEYFAAIKHMKSFDVVDEKTYHSDQLFYMMRSSCPDMTRDEHDALVAEIKAKKSGSQDD